MDLGTPKDRPPLSFTGLSSAMRQPFQGTSPLTPLQVYQCPFAMDTVTSQHLGGGRGIFLTRYNDLKHPVTMPCVCTTWSVHNGDQMKAAIVLPP